MPNEIAYQFNSEAAMRFWTKITLLITLGLIFQGCRLLVVGTALTAVTVSGAGYVVYKTGETAAVTVGEAASGTSKGVQEVVFFNNELKATCPADVRTTHKAAIEALRSLGFYGLRGGADAGSGDLMGFNHRQEKIEISMKNDGPQQTKIRIRVGAKGDMNTSRMIYGRILQGL